MSASGSAPPHHQLLRLIGLHERKRTATQNAFRERLGEHTTVHVPAHGQSGSIEHRRDEIGWHRGRRLLLMRHAGTADQNESVVCAGVVREELVAKHGERRGGQPRRDRAGRKRGKGKGPAVG